jgi:hypothetical protein
MRRVLLLVAILLLFILVMISLRERFAREDAGDRAGAGAPAAAADPGEVLDAGESGPVAEADEGERAAIALPVPEGGFVRLRFLDHRGLPVPGIAVAVFGDKVDDPFPFVLEGKTDPTGYLVLHGFEPYRRCFLHAVPPSDRTDLLILDLKPWTPRSMELTMPRSLCVSGIVVDPSGRPVEGARVVGTADGPIKCPWLTGEDGRFTIENVPDVPVMLSAVGPGWDRCPEAGKPLATRAGRDDVVLEYVPDTSLDVVVTNYEKEYGYVYMQLTVDSPAGAGRHVMGSWSRDEGRMTFPELRPHFTYRLKLRRNGIFRPQTFDVRGDAGTFRVELVEGLRIEGRVTLPEGVEKASVVASRGGEDAVSTETDAEGRFLLVGLVEGDWSLEANSGDPWGVGKTYYSGEARARAGDRDVLIDLRRRDFGDSRR